MNSRLPYLLRATYEWLADNNCTPHLVVDATVENVTVPLPFVQDGQITLNISMSATHELEMTNDAVTFSARFSGRVEHIYVPVEAVLAIYARENGEGMVFSAVLAAEEDGIGQTDDVGLSALDAEAEGLQVVDRIVRDAALENDAEASEAGREASNSSADADASDESSAHGEQDGQGNGQGEQAKPASPKGRPTLTVVK